MNKKILLSGVKPTGRPHIGNYFGAMKQFVDLLNTGDYECYFFLADYHALNLIQNAEEMRRHSLDLAIDYLAIGLDPKKATIFKQSDVSAHTELAWIFDTLVAVPYLMRAHAFKASRDKGIEEYIKNKYGLLGYSGISNKDLPDSEKPAISRTPLAQKALKEFNEKINSPEYTAESSFNLTLKVLESINVGTFNYPVLMAADILLYDTKVVPVGQDQKQHVEYARDIAQKFNNAFGETFKLPEPLILGSTGIVPGTDGQKMSKSYNNTIPLFATRSEIEKAVMSIVTDSSGEVPTNVYAIHRLFRPESELKPLYEANKGKYKALKEALIDDIDAFIKPLRERRAELAQDEAKVRQILAEGATKANTVASAKLEEVKKKIGVL